MLFGGSEGRSGSDVGASGAGLERRGGSGDRVWAPRRGLFGPRVGGGSEEPAVTGTEGWEEGGDTGTIGDLIFGVSNFGGGETLLSGESS